MPATPPTATRCYRAPPPANATFSRNREREGGRERILGCLRANVQGKPASYRLGKVRLIPFESRVSAVWFPRSLENRRTCKTSSSFPCRAEHPGRRVKRDPGWMIKLAIRRGLFALDPLAVTADSLLPFRHLFVISSFQHDIELA